MSTIDGNTSGNGESPKGSIDNPYTEAEFNNMCNAGTWTGGYVEGIGYCLPNAEVTASWSGSDFDFDSWDPFFEDDPLENEPNPLDNSENPNPQENPDSPNENTPNNEDKPSNTEGGVETHSGGSSGSSSIPTRYARETAFATQYPLIAIAIGIGTNIYPNISSSVTKLTNNLKLPQKFEGVSDLDIYTSGIADATNAMRHTLWQAVIAARYGRSIAKEAGDAHEDNPYVSLNAIEFRGTNAFFDADQTIDLLNNRIGRNIGVNANTSDILALAYIVLQEFYSHGLYTAKILGKNHYEIIKEKLSEEEYNAALDILRTLDENGNVSSHNGSW